MFNAHRLSWSRRLGRVKARPGLKTSLLVGADDVLVGLEGGSFPDTVIKVENAAGL
jgi:hypothetical protein